MGKRISVALVMVCFIHRLACTTELISLSPAAQSAGNSNANTLLMLNIHNLCMTCGCNFPLKLFHMNFLGEPSSTED